MLENVVWAGFFAFPIDQELARFLLLLCYLRSNDVITIGEN